jgi:hypothetical protein
MSLSFYHGDAMAYTVDATHGLPGRVYISWDVIVRCIKNMKISNEYDDVLEGVLCIMADSRSPHASLRMVAI